MSARTATGDGRPERALAALSGVLLVVGPCMRGAVAETDRFALASVALLLAALTFAACGPPARDLLVAASALPLQALLQLALARTEAPVLTAQAVLECTAGLAFLLATSVLARRRRAALVLAGSLVLTCLTQAALGAWQLAGSPTIAPGAYATMPFASYVNHNHFAGLVELGALLALGLAFGHARKHRTITPGAIALFGITLVLLAATLASRSRGGLVALVAGAMVFTAAWSMTPAGRPRLRGAALTALLLLLAAASTWAILPGDARARLRTVLAGGGDASTGYRADTARATLALFGAHPLMGAGLGAYEDAVTPYKRGHGDVRTATAESDVLQTLAETGLPGLAIVVWLARTVLRGRRQWLAARDPLTRGLWCGAVAATGAGLAHALFDFNLHVPANALAAAAVLGLLAARAGDETPASGARLRWIGVVLLAAAALASAWRAVGAHELERAQQQRDASARLAALDATLAHHPWLAEGYRERAWAWSGISRGPFATARRARAVADLDTALVLRPLWAEAWFDRATILAAGGRAEDAVRSARRARELDPTRWNLAFASAALLARLQGPREGIAVLEDLARRDPALPRRILRDQAARITSDSALLGRFAEN